MVSSYPVKHAATLTALIALAVTAVPAAASEVSAKKATKNYAKREKANKPNAANWYVHDCKIHSRTKASCEYTLNIWNGADHRYIARHCHRRVIVKPSGSRRVKLGCPKAENDLGPDPS